MVTHDSDGDADKSAPDEHWGNDGERNDFRYSSDFIYATRCLISINQAVNTGGVLYQFTYVYEMGLLYERFRVISNPFVIKYG